MPRSVAVMLTGHKTEAIYRRYAIVAERDLLDGAARLANLHDHVVGEDATVVPLKGTQGTHEGRTRQAEESREGTAQN